LPPLLLLRKIVALDIFSTDIADKSERHLQNPHDQAFLIVLFLLFPTEYGGIAWIPEYKKLAWGKVCEGGDPSRAQPSLTA
jgi:hypothetical protein